MDLTDSGSCGQTGQPIFRAILLGLTSTSF
jgi:hypothetical protein